MRGLGPFLRDAWRLARPYFASSDERWSARALLAAIVALNLGLVAMTVTFNFWNRVFYNALQDKDWPGFVSLLLTWRNDESGFMPGFTALAIIYIVVAVYRRYLIQWLEIRWRRWLTERYVDRWLADRAYYHISLTTPAGPGNAIETDNPDQRIADDIRLYVNQSLALSLDLLSNVVTLFSFLTILWGLSGPLTVLGVAIPGYMVWAALLYAGLGTWLTHLAGRPLVGLNFRQQRVEADFRFSLMRLRENVEGIALYAGETEEHVGLRARFQAVMENWWQLMDRTRIVNTLINCYAQLAIIFPYVAAAPRYFFGDAIKIGDLFQTADAFGQVQGAMSWFVSSYAALAEWRATVERLATFHHAIEAARAAQGGLRTEAAADFGLAGADLDLPNGQHLVENADLVLRQGQSVILTGRSGSGKSTLFRALAGIWPFGSGVVRRPSGKTLFLPQRPYIPLGTLRHVITYPEPAATHTDAVLREILVAVGLNQLADRLDDEDSWSQRLSGGEQQRLAVARALLAAPEWLFLDEATASLDPASEAAMYSLLKERLPATTIVSIAHRPAVAAFHARHIVLDRPTDAAGHFREVAA